MNSGEPRRHFDLHLIPFFVANRKAATITTTDVRRYVLHRQGADAENGGTADPSASNATINRELAALKRAFSLGIEAGKLTDKPKIPMLHEDNTRTGFFETERFEAMRLRLPAPERALVTLAFLTGWRVPSEVQPL